MLSLPAALPPAALPDAPEHLLRGGGGRLHGQQAQDHPPGGRHPPPTGQAQQPPPSLLLSPPQPPPPPPPPQELSKEAMRSGRPLVRPLWMFSPEDETSQRVADQFMLGEDLMVGWAGLGCAGCAIVSDYPSHIDQGLLELFTVD